jgi:hypothetical protein
MVDLRSTSGRSRTRANRNAQVLVPTTVPRIAKSSDFERRHNDHSTTSGISGFLKQNLHVSGFLKPNLLARRTRSARQSGLFGRN